MRRSVEIVGGGLAGLSLALALRRRDVPVVLHERGVYPRHRVCGEFIRGLDARTIRELELGPLLARARSHHEVAWFWRDEPLRVQRISPPAFALSRHELDATLADEFGRCVPSGDGSPGLGGELHTRSTASFDAREGRVLACGRTTDPRSPWIGLKIHLRDLPLARGLEMHLGRRAYVGLCALPDGIVNLCGLFSRPPSAPTSSLLDHALRSAGLAELAERVAAATVVDGSFSATAGIVFCRPRRPSDAPCLGDAQGMIPPFTGNGMAIAFTSARLAVEPLISWSSGRTSWPQTVAALRRRLHRQFRLRLALAGACHRWLLAPTAQRLLARAAAERALPLTTLARLLA